MDDVHGTPITFRTPDVRFGATVASEVPAALDRYGVDRPLVVTDEGVEEAGVLSRVTDPVERPVETHYATTEPGTDDFEDLPLDDVDGVVAVGGGSAIDTAKVAAVLAAHGGHPADYLGVGRVAGPTAPVLAVPTTSGTGSQATQTAVLAHEGVKRGISDEHLRPTAALVDPTLTEGLPAHVTARSGFDAFVHALESLTARDHRWVPERPITYQGANPVSRPLSRQALTLAHGSLERAYADGGDRAARRAMSLGAHLAGAAFSTAGLGVVHALASTVGGMTGRPHGECLAASVRPGLTYNLPARRGEYAVLARDLGVTEAATDDEAAAALLAECDRLRAALDLPGSLSDLGLGTDDVGAIVERTVAQDRRIATNPRTVDDRLRAVVAAAFD
ncbi:iron-containing alcohol dehydrogenase [Halomarina litorea]|uniref:iron-containing alcohol dehydrogenase n=1 Tax=Halomarina litorea TaxID=2961595 RepID=UPI0020C36D56|nr:iron-containing alcohol dehydrogenase [Halomarina sp. BCD28]